VVENRLCYGHLECDVMCRLLDRYSVSEQPVSSVFNAEEESCEICRTVSGLKMEARS
jgi:hypothetical protein